MKRGLEHQFHKSNDLLLSGSYNWTRSAATENIVVTNNSKIVKTFAKKFEEMWTKLA